MMDDLIRTFSERGDLAHVALFLWATSASALLVFTLRELALSSTVGSEAWNSRDLKSRPH